MNVAKLVADHLATVSAVTAAAPGGIYWGQLPAAPELKSMIRVSLIEGGRLHNLPFATPQVQVSAFARTKENVEALREAIIDELRNRSGLMGATFVVSVYQDDRTFFDNNWWHAPITIGLKLKEA